MKTVSKIGFIRPNHDNFKKIREKSNKILWNGKRIKKSKLTAHSADGIPDPTMNNWKRVTSKFGDGDFKKKYSRIS